MAPAGEKGGEKLEWVKVLTQHATLTKISVRPSPERKLLRSDLAYIVKLQATIRGAMGGLGRASMSDCGLTVPEILSSQKIPLATMRQSTMKGQFTTITEALTDLSTIESAHVSAAAWLTALVVALTGLL